MKTGKRLIAIFLVLIIIFMQAPSQAMASVLNNSAEYNEEILDAMQSFIGSEKEAKSYYDVLEKYGLLNEEGVLKSIEKITIDGEEYSLEQVAEILKGDYDGDKLAYVDGQAITLDNLWNVIVIEYYIEYLRKTYNNDGEWTEEQEDSYESLMKYLSEEGVVSTLPTNPYLEGEYSGINHGALVSFTAEKFIDGKTTVKVTLNAAKEGQKVSFDYKTVSGSFKVKENTGKVELTADEKGRSETEIAIESVPETIEALVAEAPVWYLSVSGLKNAAFAASSADAATIAFPGDPTVGDEKAIDRITGTFTKNYASPNYGKGGFVQDFGRLNLTSGEIYAINQKIVNSVSEEMIGKGYPISWLATEIGGLSEVNVSYALYPDVSGSPFYLNDMTLSVSENPIGSGTYTSYEANYNIPYTEKADLTGIRVSDDIYCSSDCDSGGIMLELVFRDTTAPEVENIYVPEGNYSTWQAVPVIVEFSEAMDAESAYITVNGIKVPAVESEPSNRLSFLYPVQMSDSVHPIITEIYAQDVSKNEISSSYQLGENEEGLVLSKATMESCRKIDTLEGATAEISYEDMLHPVLKVKVKLSEESKRNAWLASDLDENGVSASLKLALADKEPVPFVLQGETIDGAELAAEIELEPAEEEKNFTAEIYLGEELLFGSLMRITQEPLVYISEEDITLSVIVKNNKGGSYFDEEKTDGVIYIQDEPKLRAYFTLKEGNYTFGDTEAVTILDETGKPMDENAQFIWSSSDSTVANISGDGIITPTGKSGNVKFILTAVNGSKERSVSVTTDEICFGAGLTPFLNLSVDEQETIAGKPVTVFWSSNLTDKDPELTFSVNVTNEEGKEIFKQDNIKTCSVTVPGEILNYTYMEEAVHQYTLTVSAVYEDTEYSDQTVIRLVSAPAVITLHNLPSYYLLDNINKVPVQWNIRDFDRYSGDGQDLFRFYVTKNNQPLYDSNDPGNGTDGKFDGSYAIPIADVVTSPSDPTSFRDIYTVTVQAKNGTDSTWSYASYVFYVYDEDALRIWVNGEETDGSITLSNIPKISGMTQDQILAMKRDISLKTVISANYGEYAWTDLSDRLNWASSKSEVSDLNYRQGSYYEHLNAYNYTSYLPTTEFMLSGLSDGEAVITAEHILTGMQKSLNVSVSTLKDKLYLFSCTPATEATAYYTNGKGEEKTVLSNSEGKFAIYEESGIDGDVYFTSTVDGIPYYGTYYAHAIVTGEQDPTNLTLYPCNNLLMRRAAYAYVYLKNPDGTPYTGSVKLRGGVFVNGAYADNAEFAFAEGNPVSHKGTEWSEVTIDESGKLTVIMDLTQWGLSEDGLTSNDEVFYRFALETGNDNIYPLLVQIDATENEETYVRSGEASVTFRENKDGEKHPFIFDERLDIHAADVDYSASMDILERNDTIGVSDIIQNEELTISVMWWGDKSKDDKHSLSLFSLTRMELDPKGKTVTENEYPFLDEPVTTVCVHLNHDVLHYCDIGAGAETVRLNYQNVTQNTSFTEDLGLQIADMTNVYVSPDGLEKDMMHINDMIEMVTSGKLSGLPLGVGDMLPQWAIDKLADEDYKPDKEHANGFSLKIKPTEDPQTYLIYFATGAGNMSDQNVTGVYADGSTDKYFNYLPGLREVKWLFGGSHRNDDYYDSVNKEMKDAFDKKTMVQVQYLLTGYAEAKYYYDATEREWRSEYLSAGFDAGGGVSFIKYFNTLVGFVPVTAELRGGGTGAVSLDLITMQYLNEVGMPVDATEFLTKFRAYFYFKAFGGIGFDVSAFALKIGLYGQLNFDVVLSWLKRPEMEDLDGTIRYADGSPVKNTDPTLNGQHILLSGQIGIEWQLKFLFIVYEQALWSLPFDMWEKPFNDWDKIEELWGISQEHYQAQIDSIVNSGSGELVNMNGSTMLKMNLAPTTDKFDYLKTENRSWNSGTLMKSGMLGAVNNKEASVLQSNAYPYSDPCLNDDGSVLIYLSDKEAENSGSVHTGYAVMSGSGYTDMGLLNTEGGGDSSPSTAGTDSFTVAAWSSIGDAQEKDAGSVLTAEDQIIMLDSSEVYASVYAGGNWQTTPLSENSTADIAPVTAVNGSRALVAWRNVATDRVGGNIADFNVKDTIVYRIYNAADGTWSEINTLYNGTSGNIKGLNAAMLPDGTAAVIYILDTDGIDSTSDDREICWAMVGTDGKVIRTVQATSDAVADENPQITVTSVNGTFCFVAAWYSTETNGDELSYDIHIVDFGADGVILGHLPQSVDQLIREKDLIIAPTFKLSKNASSLDDLALIWVEREAMEEKNGLTVERDILNSVKFYTYGENGEIFGLTSAQRLSEAPESTLINEFDSVCRDGNVTAVFLGTTYDPKETQTISGETVNGESVEYRVPKNTSALYTMKGTYSDSVTVTDISADYDSLRCGAETTAAVTVKNDGIHPITSVTIMLGGNEQNFDGLNLLPGDMLTLYVDYSVPSDTVRDEDVTVTAITGDGSFSTDATADFGTMDLEITSAEIVEEGEGLRTIEIKLNNNSDVKLADSKNAVAIGFYSDSTLEKPINGLSPIIINDDASLKMIDEGGFSRRVVFNAEKYLSTLEEKPEEIPSAGIPIYIRVYALDGDQELDDRSQVNDSASVRCDNLETRSGSKVTIKSRLKTEPESTEVKVSVRNNRLAETSTGNIVVTLFDEENNILEQKQSYDLNQADCGLVTIGGEETTEAVFNFDQVGDHVEVLYSDLVLDDDSDASLSIFESTNIPGVTLSIFEEDPDNAGVYTAEVTAKDVETAQFLLSTTDPNAEVTLNGESLNGYADVPLKTGKNILDFKVTAADGKTVNHYILTITLSNNEHGEDEPGGDKPGGNEPDGDKPGGNEQGKDKPGIKIDTGDRSNISLYIILFILSGICVTILILQEEKRKKPSGLKGNKKESS